jgi:hypothetical protein
MRQTRIRRVRWESPPGFKCQTQSTRERATAVHSSGSSDRTIWMPAPEKGRNFKSVMRHRAELLAATIEESSVGDDKLADSGSHQSCGGRIARQDERADLRPYLR